MLSLKRCITVIALAATTGALGTVGGLSVRSAYGQAQVIGGGSGCEQDECEGGTTCKDNTGHNTSCGFDGSKCSTDACAAS